MHLLINSRNIHCCKHEQTASITLRNINRAEILIWISEVLRCWVVYDQQMTLQYSKQSRSTETKLTVIEFQRKKALRCRRKSEHGNIPTRVKSGIKVIFDLVNLELKDTTPQKLLQSWGHFFLVHDWFMNGNRRQRSTETTFTHRPLY